MTASLERFSADASPDSVAEALTECGGVIVEGMLPSVTLRRLNDEVEAPLAAADPGMGHLNPAVGFFFGKRTRHVAALASKSRTFATDVLCHPTFIGVCDRVLLPSCARYQMNLGHVIDRGPGAEQQMIHRDELVWVHVPKPHPELQVASMTALVDFTSENGATRLVPGSHRWEHDRVPEESEIADAEMPAGSTVIYMGSTLHAGGANKTPDVWRRGLHLSYVVGWLRTEENNYLATPPEVARTLPRASQELIGYAVHDAIEDAGGYLGMLEMRDPIELMSDGDL